MKNKLIITMGDSFTEGLGCWTEIPDGYTIFDEKYSADEHEEIHRSNKKYFLEYGWPSLVSKKMGYDYLLNMGQAGSSISGQAKKLYQELYSYDFKKHDEKVLIWFLQCGARISSYVGGILTNIMVNRRNSNESNFYNSYFNLLSKKSKKDKWEPDLALEHIYHIKTVSIFCKSKDIKFVPIFMEDYHGWIEYLASDITIYKSIFPNFGFATENEYNEEFLSPVCGHLNKKGYELLAEDLYNTITQAQIPVFDYNENTILNDGFVHSNDFVSKIMKKP